MTRTEIVIIGGGPAGSATASGLAALGRDVVLIERTAKPHNKVCGEFLSVETQVQLRRLGLDPSALGAVPIEQVAVYSSSRSVTSALPFRALSLSRYRLDHALLQGAQDSGARLKRNAAAKSVTPAGCGWNVLCDDGETIYGRHIVLATGKLGLRGVDDSRDGSLVGLKMHLRLSPVARRVIEGQVELFFLDDSYIGLELIEDGIANLCLVLPCATVAWLGPGWPALHVYLASVLPSLRERLAGAEPLWDKPLAVVCPAGGHLHRERGLAIYRVGDQLAHIPPFTGDGLAIALASAALAVDHIRLGRPPDVYLAAARRLTAVPIRLASIISGLARSSGGRNLMLAAAACAPGLIGTIIRRTRLTLPQRDFEAD
ncbi:NAD(P)/FAD-dependent oxidoreductase [Bradyrhizobium cenepequi]|uniref:NAD(P)/FAD-dependent oxidoreductase n=1 Tax=Bradyrhizobium cenepequi TaxID=2821403 RepID=UPI001CE3B5B4|nr:FAD-dependent monooxygenase [Bradyrhizobium cenepequi]MCA6111606.1 FAD-dependent monooxygenase [Bradyrhizobium cenepequi]